MTPLVAAIDARHEHVYLQVFGAGRPHHRAAAHRPLREAVRAAHDRPGAHRRLGAALIAAAWPRPSRRRRWSTRRAPRHRLGRPARRRRRRAEAPPRPLYLRAPDAQPQDAAPAAAPMIGG